MSSSDLQLRIAVRGAYERENRDVTFYKKVKLWFFLKINLSTQALGHPV